ncbi:MAG: hypothetical protein H6907_00125 [Hyphomicrobiales bacterium]|nr:hypothetical protein [Hyphomicrobiales bacterium]MCP5370115.1 hypothetical protein [Hyphomicrobiales bacterium]
MTKAPGGEAVMEEDLLRDQVHRIGESPAGAYAVQVHLSGLRASNRQPNFIRIAARAFEPVLNNFDARLFRLSNADLVLLCRDVPVDEVEPALDKVRALFSEDPLTQAEEGSLDDMFSSWYDLSEPNDFNAFLAITLDLIADAEERRRQRPDSLAATGVPQMEGAPLEPAVLAQIQDRLADVRIDDLIQAQSAISLRPGGGILYREHTVSMAGLQMRVAPDVNLLSDAWLFQYLTESVDRRLLLIVARTGLAASARPLSINLNISTVLSREFQQFTRAIGDQGRDMVIEFQLIDVFADVGTFHYARDLLRDRGFRVLIDGLNPVALQFFDPGLLGADFVKFEWSRELGGEAAEGGAAAAQDQVKQAIAGIGRDAAVLSRVESEAAMKFGLGLGIIQFQGFFVDRIAGAMRSKGMI